MKKNRFYTFNRVLFISVSLLLGMAFAQAQTFLGSAGDRLWSNADNWLDGLKPTEQSENVTINSDVLVDEDVVIQNLNNATPCTLTIQSGKKMTVTITINWNNGDFILEDGAQLVCQHELHAIVKRKIVAYDQDIHAMEFIASPVMETITPSLENGFLTDPDTGYDLFYYNESNHQWVDFHETPFNLENGHGYAYINALDTTLLFEGTVKGSNVPAVVGLEYHASNGALAGCNMVGNPLPCNAFANRSYYNLDEKGISMLAVPASLAVPIPPCKGVFVKAENPVETVSFSKIEDLQTSENHGYIELFATKANTANAPTDNAIVSFNPGDDLGKFLIFEEQPSLYFTNDKKDLAIISISSVDALPLKFIAAENTSYTIRIELKNLDINYLHLIDNITGNNIDLLIQPSYTFNATTSDYTSRFKLVFDPHYSVEENDLSADFAYYTDGTIYIHNIETQNVASLQVVDMNGRIVYSEAINNRDGVHTVSTNLVPGIYLLRLASGNAVMTQKMVIY